jgi:hypothetical protein
MPRRVLGACRQSESSMNCNAGSYQMLELGVCVRVGENTFARDAEIALRADGPLFLIAICYTLR